jgi:hypothetical protein
MQKIPPAKPADRFCAQMRGVSVFEKIFSQLFKGFFLNARNIGHRLL